MRLLKHFPVQPSKSSETTWTFDEVDRVELADGAKGPSGPDVTDTPRPRGVRAAAAPPNALTASTFPVPVSQPLGPVAPGAWPQQAGGAGGSETWHVLLWVFGGALRCLVCTKSPSPPLQKKNLRLP